MIPDGEFNDERTFGITIPDAGVSLILRLAETIATIEARRKPHRGAYEMDGKRIIKMLDQFVRQNNSNVWLELMDGSSLSLCCCPRNLADVMEKNVWTRSVSYVLTSGTMSDGRNFSFFKKENGIARLPKYLVGECTTVSPFDYQNHTRLYIPEDMPLPDNKSEDYINAITERILRLIDATNGHTAILFTSYKVLHSVYQSQARDFQKQISALKSERRSAFESTIQTMLDEVLKMRALLNEIEEPLEEFDGKLFLELVRGIEITKQDEMTVTFLGGLKFTELI